MIIDNYLFNILDLNNLYGILILYKEIIFMFWEFYNYNYFISKLKIKFIFLNYFWKMKRKVKKIKNRFPDHSDAIVAIHSPDGFDGNQIITASKDGSVFCNTYYVIIDIYKAGIF